MSVGRPFDHTMDEYLLRPLGLTLITTVDALHAGVNNVRPHYKIDGKVQRVPPISMGNLLGAVGHTLSARDAAMWLAFHFEEGAREGAQLVSRQQLRETHLLQVARRDRT
jgi:CubicO group peptidase (beta-lactamase class C family)